MVEGIIIAVVVAVVVMVCFVILAGKKEQAARENIERDLQERYEKGEL